jgi:DNA-binding SARP family transcriptional activator
VRVHLVEGNLAEAVRAYDAFRTMLAEELGVAPSQQMDQLICDLPRPRSGSTERERSARVTAR